MNRFLVFSVIIFTVFISYTVVAQNWQMQNSNFPTNISVIDFSAVNSQVCWAIGIDINGVAYGGFSRTTDGGNNWVCDTIAGTWTGYLSQIFAFDADTAYITSTVLSGGNSKGIYKTTDGGTTWNRQNAYNATLYGAGYIHFFDTQNGVVIGDPNLETYTTTNGGQTWNPVIMPPALADEYTRNSGNGITAAVDNIWFSTGARIFKSTDKGYSWNVILNEPQYSSYWPCIKFQDSQIGIYTLGRYSSHIDRKTNDGGITWNTLSNPIPQGLNTKGMQHIPGTTSTYILTGIGRHGINALVLTNDAGESWSIYDNECNFFEFPSVSVGWVSFDTNAVKKYIGPPLPVELTSFTTSVNGKEVILNWSTATELNNQGFEIQRSTQGKEFFTVGFVNGHGTTTEQQNYNYADKNLDNGNYYYRLKQVDFNGNYEYSDVVEVDYRGFNSYLLEQNYPNPFNPTTTIGFGIQNKSNVKIIILNAIGEEVAVVLNEEREPGFHQVEFNVANLPSGVYFYQLKAGNFIETKKMLLLK